MPESGMEKIKAVFLDKDGTLIVDVPYNVNPELIEFTPGAAVAVQKLHTAGYKLIIISNQSGVAHGYFPETALPAVEQRISQMLNELGVPLSGFYYCPHHPANDCPCRKPAPGLILQAANDLLVDLTESWMVGDILNDSEAGKRAGCRTILLDNGHETEWLLNEFRQPDYYAPTLDKAAEIILGSR